PRRFARALILLHRTFRSLPLGARLHALIRFLTCPFLRVVAHVPPGARVLEIGAGHGVFLALAKDAGAARATGVEPDLRKVFVAPRSLEFIAGFDDAVRGHFDAIAMIDVLYAIPKSEWDPLLERIAARTDLLLLKEMDPRRRLKNAWNRLQETISIKITRITMAEAIVFEEPEAMRARLGRAGFTEVRVVAVDGGYPHPHVLYVCSKG
ncbi:MAG TPA: methyltransferase domain-containing protein, partial [Thermoanaerobaculia bacterium]|nr:methyltransferase domain-containing protein [Thermoanaerobaculia bacterium]